MKQYYIYKRGLFFTKKYNFNIIAKDIAEINYITSLTINKNFVKQKINFKNN